MARLAYAVLGGGSGIVFWRARTSAGAEVWASRGPNGPAVVWGRYVLAPRRRRGRWS